MLPPPTDEEFAKGKIRELLKEYCNAIVAMDPAAVQRVFPKVDIIAMRMQLNPTKYKSVQCSFGDPKYVSLDPSAGTAKVQAELKRVYDYTILKPDTIEHIVDMTLSRSSLRSPWQIDAMKFNPKPK